MWWGKKGALLMLTVAVLWTALPTAACLLPSRRMGRSACCLRMAKSCPMSDAAIKAPCCQIQPGQAAVIADSPIFPERDQTPAYAFHPVGALVPLVTHEASWYNPQTFAPEISPGESSILRI